MTQYYTATAIDGFIADEHNSITWLQQQERSSKRSDRFRTFFADVGAIAMGATSYEWILAHEGPLQNPERWHQFYGDTPCWVFTHRHLPAIPGAPLHFVQGAVAPVHKTMADTAGGKNIWLIGGGDLVGQFMDSGLLDQIILLVAPVTLGAGAPLLPRRYTTQLRLSNVDRDETFAFLTYDVDEAPEPGANG